MLLFVNKSRTSLIATNIESNRILIRIRYNQEKEKNCSQTQTQVSEHSRLVLFAGYICDFDHEFLLCVKS